MITLGQVIQSKNQEENSRKESKWIHLNYLKHEYLTSVSME